MLSVEKSYFKYKPDLIRKLLKRVDNHLIAVDDISVMFPVRYENKNLAYITNTVKVLTVFAIVDKYNNYGTVLGTLFMELTPSKIYTMEVDEAPNKVLTFNKGSLFCGNVKLIVASDYLFNVFDEFFIGGRIPWYLTPEQVSNVYLGGVLGGNILALEILTAIIARSAENKKVFSRQITKSKKDKPAISYVGLSDIYNSFDNTNSKINGSRYDDGVTSAIINKETKTTKVASLLRS